jgi:TatD DNase family protein
MVGIGGVVTYKNAGVAKSVEKIPLDRIVLETDSPYLTPVPFRGKRNESSYLVHIAGKIAEIKGCPLEEVAAATTANAYRMFGL